MDAEMTIGRTAAQVRVVAQAMPAEVQDMGKVRMGGAIRLDWMVLEILKFLSTVMHVLPGQGG